MNENNVKNDRKIKIERQRYNHVAHSLSDPKFRLKVVRSKKSYKRSNEKYNKSLDFS